MKFKQKHPNKNIFVEGAELGERTHELRHSRILSASDDIHICFWCFWADTDGFTPQLQIPITTRSDQQQHMELEQWWVTTCTASVESYPVTCAVNNSPRSQLAYCFCQQASLYRGGYNRFTPYWAARPQGGSGYRRLSWTLGLADPRTLQDREWDP